MSSDSPSFADTPCPKTIAAIQQDTLSHSAKKIMSRLYADLGCDVDFTALPAKRGIDHFNKGLVDGEIYRLRRVESLYRRAFVRSHEPLFVLSNSLWSHPELKDQERYQIGYILGVVWQENYMNNRPGKAFASAKLMYEAYNNGLIKGFLAADSTVGALANAGRFFPAPEKGAVLLSEPLYHYLGQEFGPIMDRFSKKLRNNPFAYVGRDAVD